MECYNWEIGKVYNVEYAEWEDKNKFKEGTFYIVGDKEGEAQLCFIPRVHEKWGKDCLVVDVVSHDMRLEEHEGGTVSLTEPICTAPCGCRYYFRKNTIVVENSA